MIHIMLPRFVSDTISLIDKIFERGNIPILAGGTMMYFNSLLKGIAPTTPRKKYWFA